MRITTHLRRGPLTAAAIVAGSAAVLLVLAGCSSAAAGATATPSAAAGGGNERQQGQGQDRGGISGLIAYAQDDLLQVQGDDEQTAVRYTADTTVRKTSTVAASTISVGDCILAITGQDADTATRITITEASDDGTCTGGFGGGFPGRGGGAPTDAPSGAPADGGPQGGGMPSGAPGDGGPGGSGGFGQFTVGKVTAVSASALTVETVGQDDDTTTAKVAIGSDTTVTATTDATASAIAVGLCVTAAGTADDKGGYDATALTLSDPDEDGNCSTGFGGGFPRGGMPGRGDGDREGGSNG